MKSQQIRNITLFLCYSCQIFSVCYWYRIVIQDLITHFTYTRVWVCERVCKNCHKIKMYSSEMPITITLSFSLSLLNAFNKNSIINQTKSFFPMIWIYRTTNSKCDNHVSVSLWGGRNCEHFWAFCAAREGYGSGVGEIRGCVKSM